MELKNTAFIPKTKPQLLQVLHSYKVTKNIFFKMVTFCDMTKLPCIPQQLANALNITPLRKNKSKIKNNILQHTLGVRSDRS